MYLDGLPSAVIVRDSEQTNKTSVNWLDGIPVGKYIIDGDGKERYILYNHLDLEVFVQPIEDSNEMRIVSFEVEPRSYSSAQPITLEYRPHEPLYLDEILEKAPNRRSFDFSYSVVTIRDE